MKTAWRRDRLLTLLHRGPTTVPAVAKALGVSERTVYRDIAFLRDGGHDIRATPGPGGGVRGTPEGRPRAVHFEVAEIIGLALSVAILNASFEALDGPPALGRQRQARPIQRSLGALRERQVRRRLQDRDGQREAD
ncbi:MAG: HTH domain-containing protein, partial [Myxococcota bacterium]